MISLISLLFNLSWFQFILLTERKGSAYVKVVYGSTGFDFKICLIGEIMLVSPSCRLFFFSFCPFNLVSFAFIGRK